MAVILKAAAYRLLVLLILVTSPVLYPALLLVVDHRVTLAGLREMYDTTWKHLVRGYP